MKRVLIFSMLLFLASCSFKTVTVHGNMIRDDDLVYVEQGETSKNDLIMMFGQPTMKSSFDNIWYYVGQTIEKKYFFKPNVTDRRVVEFSFNDDNIISSISGYELDDGREIALNSNETRSLGAEQNVVQQLLGNIGKFNAPNAMKELGR